MRVGVLCIAVVAFLASCERGDDKGDVCARAVRHVTFGMTPEDAPGQPSGGERAVMEAAVTMSIAKCRSEGLTQAQADCIFAAEGIEEMLLELPDCPAIAENKPSWLTLPPPEARQRLRESQREDSAGE